MQFNSHISGQDLYTDALDKTGADSDSFTIAMFTRWANKWYDDAHLAKMLASGRWIADDKNNTGLPIATDTITATQQDYQLDDTHYRVYNVLVKDESGEWSTLKQMDPRSDEMVQYLEDDSTTGTPTRYWIIKRSLFLHPIPDYTQAASLKVFHQPSASYFATTDTTKEPDLYPKFHTYISDGASYEYAKGRLPDLERSLRETLPRDRELIKDFYSVANKDYQPRLMTKYRSAR